jgi:hypothetical protein
MNCHTCHTDVPLARRVVILDLVAGQDDLPSPYRTAFVCPQCYQCLDTTDGVGLIDGRMYLLDSHSRFGKAASYDRPMYDEYQRTEAVRLTAEAS